MRNLSWKLARVLAGDFTTGLLDSYHLERHEAAREMVEVAVMLGDQIQPTDAAAAAERDATFAAINKEPGAAEAFSRDIAAPLLNVQMPRGWRGEDDSAGHMLPQPPISHMNSGLRLDDTLGPGFIALTRGEAGVADAIVGHPLWQAMQPSIHVLPAELEEFAGLAPGEILLVRPDRFVLARLPDGVGALLQLDALHTTLLQEQPVAVTAGQG